MTVVKPSLVIGVGGTGYWILSLLKRQLYINYGVKAQETDEIKFLLLDTLSEGTFEEYKEKNDDSIIAEYQVNRSEYIHLSEPPEGFFNWADDPEKYDIPRYRWFRRNILKQYVQEDARWKLREGAAQIRQFGRMAFFFNINKVAAAMNEKLSKIKMHAGSATIPVWIFGSFAGGTGSGMMMDVAMLAKLIQDEFNHSVQTIGGFVLPEVYSDKLTTSIAQGYAGIRELQRFTSKGTQSVHKAFENGKDHAGKVEFDSSHTFYHSKSIFDNMLFFNEECRNEEKRRGFFNKVVDGISILLDPKGSDTFLSSVINHTGDRLTSLSTCKIFIPTALYKKKFVYNYMSEKINRLFPVNEAGNILSVEDEIKKEAFKADIDNLFSKLAPYFLVLQGYINNDVEAEKYARKVLLDKPRDMLEKLLGIHEQGKYYTDPPFNPNDINDIQALFSDIYRDVTVPEVDKKNWEERKKIFKTELEGKYNNYKKIFDKSPDNKQRKTIKTKIVENFIAKIKTYLRDTTMDIREMYHTLKEMKRILKGEDENNPTAIIGILNVAARKVFDSREKEVDTHVIRGAERYNSSGPIKKLMGYNFSPLTEAMKAYKNEKMMELTFAQSRNILALIIEIHHRLIEFIERLEHALITKNNQISISGGSIKARYNEEVRQIDGILKAGVGYATSIGLKSNISNLKDKYEQHLQDMIFGDDAENIHFSIDFNGEQFIISYVNGDVRLSDDQEFFNDKNEKETLWDRVEYDMQRFVSEKIDLHAGIVNYLNWARKQYKEQGTQSQFGGDLLNSLTPASGDFIKLREIPEKLEGRLVYGDDNPILASELEDLRTGLGNNSNCKTVNDTFRGASSYHIDFGDKNSLVFLVSSNTVHPAQVDILNRMNATYCGEIQDSSGDWRPNVHHNYKAEWEIMDIEKSLPDVKDSGIHSLTHSSFYWVLEEAEIVDLFVSACAAGIIRMETGAVKQEFWICAPQGKTFQKNKDDDKVMCITDPDVTSDIFTALVKFVVEQKPFKKMRPYDFKTIKKMRDEAIIKQKNRDWDKIKSDFIKKDPYTIDIEHYNRGIPENEPELYEKHKNLFLARIFHYYLMENKKPY
jgi:hypothetical protein